MYLLRLGPRPKFNLQYLAASLGTMLFISLLWKLMKNKVDSLMERGRRYVLNDVKYIETADMNW